MKFNSSKAILVLLLSISLVSCKKTNSTEKTTTNYVQENYDKLETTITMRDGIKLFTAIYTPKDKSKNILFYCNAHLTVANLMALIR